MVVGLINANPVVYERKERRVRSAPTVIDEYEGEPIDQLEIFDHIRDIKDPEHPYSLEELKVVTEDSIEVNDKKSYVRVTFTPTVEHCSMATVIGLCIRVKLIRSLPARYKIDIRVAPGTHATEAAVNKQLNDKERVAAALENPNLVEMVDSCLEPTFALSSTAVMGAGVIALKAGASGITAAMIPKWYLLDNKKMTIWMFHGEQEILLTGLVQKWSPPNLEEAGFWELTNVSANYQS